MPDYKTTVKMMHELLRGQRKPADIAEAFQANLKRLSIYPAFVMGHVTRFLETNFISLRSMFDEAIWNQLCEDYYREYPPSDWRLYRSAENFPVYLSQSRKSGKYGITDFHIELAEFEWTEIAVYKNELVIPCPDEIDLVTLNPTLTVVQFNYPIAQFVHHNREQKNTGGQKTALAQEHRPQENPENVFFFRNPKTHLAQFCVPDGRLLFAFKIAHDGLTVEDASRASGQNTPEIESILNEASQTGLILLPEVMSK